ncbi:peptidoglycan-binding domain-containing protein [Nocardia sp. GAS34]|uniref:peptidoglycan-binding domain-containing protein n=1 Tax=unclassified Nocardia TaxID=2637762 RepID=UPI003D23C33F
MTKLQQTLNRWYPKLPALAVDGVFGAATHDRVVYFQQHAGLAADGVVGPKTWAALGFH